MSPERWNEAAYAALEVAFSFVERLGLPLAILAWATVFLAAAGMAGVLGRYSLRACLLPSLGVGALALFAHSLDYWVTLRMSPTLGMEANPIWRIVIDAFGLRLALAYGLSGKLLLSVLSFELFAYYLLQRERLYPMGADGIRSFWGNYGRTSRGFKAVRWANLVNFFCFGFALLSPFVAYVALLNGLVNHPAYLRLPSMPIVLVVYLGALAAGYPLVTYRAFRRSGHAG
ncbi:MAG: hypothetical protein V3U03_11505 [Myxococcota bacterium]